LARQARELLDVAGIQTRVLAALRLRGGEEGVDLERISQRLLNVSEMYNDYAGPCGLYELCLVILKCCRHDDEETIRILWRTIIAKELGESDHDEAKILLGMLRKGTPLEEQEGNLHVNRVLFEDGEWIGALKEKIVGIGRELYGEDADYTFPVPFLVRELERLRRAYESLKHAPDYSFSPWPLQCFVDVGVSYAFILESYSDLLEALERDAGSHPAKKIQYLASIAEVLKHWLTSALSSPALGNALVVHLDEASERAPNGTAGAQLARALASGLKSSVDNWKAALEGIVGDDVAKTSKVLGTYAEVEELLTRYFVRE